MLLKLSNNYYLDITFGDGNYSLLPKYIKNENSRFTTQTALWHCHWLGFGITVIKENYCDLIHICIDPNNQIHTNNVVRFIGILNIITSNYNHPFWDSNPGFNVNYKNGKFYITGERHWFITHNLGSLLQYTYPELYMSADEMKCFPDY